MARELKHKVVVITGGANGIGAEIADKYLEKEAKVAILLDLDDTKGNETANTLSSKYGDGKAVFIKCNVITDLTEVSETIIATYKNVDVLVNSAGIASGFIPTDEATNKRTMDVNATALILWTMKFWEHMRTDKGGKGGTIVNIGSIFSFRSTPFFPIYQASKFAVLGFNKAIGHEYNYNRSGVRVVAICPGVTETNLCGNTKDIFDEQTLANDATECSEGFVRQKVDAVGKAAVEVFETADSGTAWVVEGAKPIEQVN